MGNFGGLYVLSAEGKYLKLLNFAFYIHILRQKPVGKDKQNTYNPKSMFRTHRTSQRSIKTMFHLGTWCRAQIALCVASNIISKI